VPWSVKCYFAVRSSDQSFHCDWQRPRMASPQKLAAKQNSRWGFLQQAVASVESRLDTILADEEDVPKKAAPAQVPKENVASKRPAGDLSRSNSGTQANDRLQQRLARAMAKKNAGTINTPGSGSETTSAVPSPRIQATDGEGRISLDIDRSAIHETGHLVEETSATGMGMGNVEKEALSYVTPENLTEQLAPPVATQSSRTSLDTTRIVSGSSDDQENDNLRVIHSQPRTSVSAGPEVNVEDKKTQEEINGYIERIDALQAKLNYLSKEAAESAKQAAAAAQSGSAEKKMLEKDEKIALLMEEGQKLSKAEMKYITTIKKMKSQALAASKEQDDMRMKAEKAQKIAATMEERARRAEAASKRAEENLAASLTTAQDLDAILKERNALSATLAEMKGELSRANARAEEAEARAQAALAERERKRNDKLQDDLMNAKMERELSGEKLKREISDLQASLQREKEHSRVMETEMLGEQAVLESKLESFRARMEEVSTNSQGDVQAKLLRQIETLQSQYAAASQNWQGIESTLLSRISNLERERDDAATQEAEVRKKVRDATLKAKNAERHAEQNSFRASELERQHTEVEHELQQLLRKVKDQEELLSKAQNELDESRASFEKELAKRIDEEKSKWAALPVRYESPVASIRKGSAFDTGHLISPLYPPHSRRPSTMHGADSSTPPRQHSTTMLQSLANGKGPANGTILETPSIITSMDHDEYFNNVPPTPASTRGGSASRGVNDIISTSTAGAGPSVQLVERMSANVRRLESEKAAFRDELARLQTQRDEARSEIVKLMKEVEHKRGVEERIKSLETEHETLSKRHEATLEMLGEKSELVEELKADVADVKQMYRELVDTMGRRV
jgi:hypothetical protein